MKLCPGCDADICTNTALTYLIRLIDLVNETNQDELQCIDESYINMHYMLNDEYPEKLRKPRKIPTKLPQLISLDSFAFDEYFQAISVTCRNSPLVFEYVDSFIDVEYMDN